jgi:hypothetical protein
MTSTVKRLQANSDLLQAAKNYASTLEADCSDDFTEVVYAHFLNQCEDEGIKPGLVIKVVDLCGGDIK